MTKRPILIVGGGLGGLTTALALARRGARSRVLEGAPEFGAIGYGIQFGPNVFHVFDLIGLTDASLRARFKHPYIIVHRIDLHNALLDACRRTSGIELVPDAMVMDVEDR